jgi:allantoate deiminase
VSDAARVLLERADVLGAISEEPDRLTRRFATAAMGRALDQVAEWLAAAGMSVRRDAIGNLTGRYEASRNDAGTLVIGSHLDTVPGAGRYDGVLGVLAGLAVVERLASGGRRLPCALEVVAFAEEEGVRFGTGYVGSRVWRGAFERSQLRLVDGDGVTLEEAVRASGGDPERIDGAARRQDDLLGYLEVHIEQGPRLEKSGLPVGVVSAIAGQTRGLVVVAGEAGHAGTIPMTLRRDALAGAAELVLAIEQAARSEPGLVATVGRVDVASGASNVVPGRVALTLDLRHADDAIRGRAREEIVSRSQEIAGRRGLEVAWETLRDTPSVAMSTPLSALLQRAASDLGLEAPLLVSGAGHDAAVVAGVTPAAMLFVRCAGGISHSPDELVTEADVAVALEVLERCVELVARSVEDGENG